MEKEKREIKFSREKYSETFTVSPKLYNRILEYTKEIVEQQREMRRLLRRNNY